jgi:hypothetical protein
LSRYEKGPVRKIFPPGIVINDNETTPSSLFLFWLQKSDLVKGLRSEETWERKVQPTRIVSLLLHRIVGWQYQNRGMTQGL